VVVVVVSGGGGDEEGGWQRRGWWWVVREKINAVDTSLIFVRRYSGITRLVRKPGPPERLSPTSSSSMAGRA
jgi:hypothetical protein